MDKQKYLEQVYSGFLGMCAGVRLGAPVEPTIWTYERILDTYGDIRGYVKNYSNFAADDDVNGPVFFIRSLLDFKPPLTAEKVGKTWLNYAREGIGFYWWGGYGTSTEHTAYVNLKNGISAPDSGSIMVNGKAIAEQIGGQIFIDSWGLVFPDNPNRAAEYAKMAASVSHDGNGIYGAVFITALISMAFSMKDIPEMIGKALELIPEDSEYVRVVKAVRDFHISNPGDWRACRDFLTSNFGYDKYPGVCHIIPNSGVIALALYYGKGDFARTIEIATMSGWDTDCNAGNAGTILGVMVGPGGIPERYSRPINDFHAASSIAGALNILDLPTVSKELAILGLKQSKDDIPYKWKKGTFSDDIYFDFTISGTTHGIRTSSEYLAPLKRASGGDGGSVQKRGQISFTLDRFQRGDEARIFYKPYYRREDFDDERYSPTFTPLVYPGQILKINAMVERFSGQRISVAPYVRDSSTKKIFSGKEHFPESNVDFTVEWEIPPVSFAVDEAGLLIRGIDSEKFLGELTIYNYSISGTKSFYIDFADEVEEFRGLSRCSLTGGSWSIEDDQLHVITNETFQLFTGPYYSSDYNVETVLTPLYGISHLVTFRSIGAERGYFFGLHGSNKVALIKRDHENLVIEENDFSWELGKSYTLKVEAIGDVFRCSINGTEIINFKDKEAFPTGMAGLGKLEPGRTLFNSITFSEK